MRVTDENTSTFYLVVVFLGSWLLCSLLGLLLLYVDCDEEWEICSRESISALPTWKDDKGNYYEGVKPLVTLGLIYDCEFAFEEPEEE